MKNKYKITPEIRKIIAKTAESLPKMQKIGSTGKPLFRLLNKCVMGKDLPKDAKIHGVKNPSPNKLYHTTIKDPIYLNHSVSLNDIYVKDGMAGVKTYTKFILEEYASKNASDVKPIEPEQALNISN